MNRKFVFERPLLIVGVALAAAYRISDGATLLMVLLPFLSLLLFNLWFTYNRMLSSARIVSYIQLEHESDGEYKYIGWENSLREFRYWCHSNRTEYKEQWKKEREVAPYKSMGFYNPIFNFHVMFGFIGVIILSAYPKEFTGIPFTNFEQHEFVWSIINGLLLMSFLLLCSKFRPKNLCKAIEVSRNIWIKVLKKEDGTST